MLGHQHGGTLAGHHVLEDLLVVGVACPGFLASVDFLLATLISLENLLIRPPGRLLVADHHERVEVFVVEVAVIARQRRGIVAAPPHGQEQGQQHKLSRPAPSCHGCLPRSGRCWYCSKNRSPPGNARTRWISSISPSTARCDGRVSSSSSERASGGGGFGSACALRAISSKASKRRSSSSFAFCMSFSSLMSASRFRICSMAFRWARAASTYSSGRVVHPDSAMRP